MLATDGGGGRGEGGHLNRLSGDPSAVVAENDPTRVGDDGADILKSGRLRVTRHKNKE